jgi:hypothetical protein
MSRFSAVFRKASILLLALILTACASSPQAFVTPTSPGVPNTGETATSDSGPILATAVGVGTGIPAASVTPESTVTPFETTPSNIVVTRENNGQAIRMAVGQTFLLSLGESYRWSITVSDESVLTREVNILVIRGAQGVYKALKPGQTTLSAVGDPACRDQKPPCMMPSVTFEVTVIVQ